jgi:hypothetical protein
MLTGQRKKLFAALLLALFAQALTFAPLPDWLRLGALLVWAVLIPGHLLSEVVGRDFGAPALRLEWGLYAVGVGYVLLLTLLLALSYLPGGLSAWQFHLGVDLLLLLLTAAAWRQAGAPAQPTLPLARWEIGGLVALLIVAAGLRLVNLGYAEFHGDEARAVLRAAAVIQGYEDVLFLHKKGPAEILLPTAVFAVLGRIDEATARLPFALANLTALAAIFFLGRRLFGPVAGITALLLLTVDGFFIGFARLVQYQSLVMLFSALTLLTLVRLWPRPHQLVRGLLLAALALAGGLLAHYEAGLVALPALFAVGVLWQRYPAQRRDLWRGLGAATLLGALLLGLFYLPFLLHEQFGATYTYLVDRRIAAEGVPVNNIADLWIRLTTYSSAYYALTLIALLVAALLACYRRTLGRWGGAGAGGALLLLVALTAWQPAWATLPGAEGRDLWIFLAILALLPAWFGPRIPAEERLVWLWFGLLWVILLGFTGKPRTHVYVFFAPWALLGGMVVARMGAWWAERSADTPAGRTHMAWTGVVMGTVALLVFGGYVYQLFAYTRIEVLRNWQTDWPWGYWRPYAALDNKALFGFPLANGWKVVGQLYADGTLSGDYSTNEVEFWTPLWYTRGRLRCDDRATWFLQIRNHQADPAGYAQALEGWIGARFAPWGQVTLHDDPRMLIRRTGAPADGLQRFALEEYAAAFDRAATPDLPLGYPVVQPHIAHPLDLDFGGQIRLEGYALDAPAPLAAGDVITLTLYWRALQEIDASYKVFNQAFYGDGVMVAQQDGYPVCGGRGTWVWNPGDQVVDVHRIQIRDDAPDGLYPLYTGLYIEETLARLDVVDNEGRPVGDQVHLTDLRVGPAP